MNRLTVRGKFVYDGEQKFFARGVSYGPFIANSRGERYPEPDRAAADFALMRDLGVNLVRVYVPPPSWMFELAGEHELRMMVGMPWPFHMAFLDSAEMTRDIRRTISEGLRTMKQFSEVIFAYSLGNEIRADIVRWHGRRAVNKFLRELYDLGKQNDPDGLFTYSNYPPAEYLDLNFLDLVSFNVYLHREADFRRYLTHLLATTYDRPLILSETGMDTIREGEAHQAELLRWQARAAFELGLSGFVVFAFTDEWHTGGAEISDWAFGLVTRERRPKEAFKALSGVFRGALPPPIANLPQASVVVCAYNAAATLAACLESLRHLNYPDYEVIVVDDGSTDSTSEIAERAGVRLLKLQHRGLAAARNAGIAAASGRIVAFIDADAEAERDWLYHLGETITRSGSVAAGGQNFPPQTAPAMQTAIAAAPGEPREVRAGDDTLDQLCGCNMALDRTGLATQSPFDLTFTTAGDDVDFSWGLRERGMELAYAPAAVVIHRRRPTLGAYLAQQFGYGRAEAILKRKYPNRFEAGATVYGERGWFARWLGAGARVYYGAFGRGLFQSLYHGAAFPLALQAPLRFSWLVFSILMVLAGVLASDFLTIIGAVGVVAVTASAIAWAAVAALPRGSSPGVRIRLALLSLVGPLWRSYARDFRWRRTPLRIGDDLAQFKPRWSWRGRAAFPHLVDVAGDETVIDHLKEALREALFERGATVAVSDGYQPYDLQVQTSDGVAVALNLLNARDGRMVVGWNLGITATFAARRLLALIAAVGLMLLAGISSTPALLIGIFGALALATLYVLDARRIPPLVELAVRDVGNASMTSHPMSAEAAG